MPPDIEPPAVILVVDDEAAVNRVVTRYLSHLGYRVLDARNGDDALRIYRAHQAPVALVLTDVVMPGMSGRELVERLADHQQGFAVLYTSGYTDDEIVRRGVASERAAFLPKPYTPRRLAAAVRAALDAQRGTSL